MPSRALPSTGATRAGATIQRVEVQYLDSKEAALRAEAAAIAREKPRFNIRVPKVSTDGSLPLLANGALDQAHPA